ncbi:cohesin domain-containing protein [Clostridium merdae]|uniref:cohesin domain-containing protein n=1 Tax=Clostridium merdae TaxID=1958780 RepID=UPI00135666D6|nr:kelch repeat-containing protein [Clostridium merdae]
MKLNMKRGLVFLLILTLMSSIMPFAFAEEPQNWKVKSKPQNLYNGSAYNHVNSVTHNGYIYYFGGKTITTSTDYNKTEMYDFSTNQWHEKANMPISRLDFDTVSLNNKAYLVGGYPNGDVLLAYDFASDSWETKASLPFKSSANSKAIVMDGKIYTSNESLFAVYDPQKDTWESKASLPTPIYNYDKIEVVNGRLYAIIGRTNKNIVVLEYDPLSDVWTSKASARTYREKFNTAAINGIIYVIGGMDGPDHINRNVMEAYDPISNKWSTLASMKEKKFDVNTIVANNEIYVIGGKTGVSSASFEYLNTVEKYNINENKWDSLPSLKYTRSTDVQVHYVSNSLFVFKGYSDFPEIYTLHNNEFIPTLTVTASPNKVKVGNRFSTTVAIHNVSNIYAEDIKIDYDAERFEYLGASAKDGLKIYKEDTSTPGSVRFIVAHLGKDSGATGDKDLIELTFRAKSVGIGKVDITKGRIADNDVLEMDVAEENCGEDTIEVEANKDVNRTGEYTLLDLGIDAYYYGLQADQTDTTRFDTDVIPDGVIDDKDLTAITQSILDNSNYPFN